MVVAGITLVGCMTESPEAKRDKEHYEASWRAVNARITNCGVCNGPVVRLKSVSPPRSPAQNKNMFVWNESICGNLLVGPDSPICKNCWHVCIPHDRPDLEYWTRSIGSASGFVRPLHPAIVNAPISNARATFTQTYRANRFAESAIFWCKDSSTVRSCLSAHAGTNRVSIKIEPYGDAPGQIVVEIKTND